jgi:uncharacterized membrane protein
MNVKGIERSRQLKSMQKRKIGRSFFTYFIVAILILGVFFRFTNLGTKVYWGDETVTSLRVSGHTFAELKQKAFRGQEISVAQLQQYQYPDPNKNILDTITGLAAEEPQHPPLYFVMVKLWVQWFGNSVAVTRSFSAVLSLLALVCLYWLVQELFNSPVTSWIAVALMAVSPFHVLYAQEARSSSFWTMTILLSGAALLRARRLQTNTSWIVYTLTLIVSFYTFILSGVIAIGHGIYLFVDEQFRFTKTVRNYLLSLIATLILFVPWVIAVLSNFSEADATTSWTKVKVPLSALMKTWLLNLSRPFIDFNYNFVTRNLFMYAAIAVLVILVAYSFYYLCRHTKQRIWLFVFTLMGITASLLVVPDLAFGGIRSSVARYAIPCFLGIQISVAYLFASQITAAVSSQWRQQLWRIAMVVLISASIASCATSSQANVWWNKYNAATLPEAASVVNQSSNPIFVTSWYGLMAFSHAFSPHVRVQPLEKEPISLTNPENSELFVYDSSKALKALTTGQGYRIEQAYEWKETVEPVYQTQAKLWKLAK